MFTIMYGSTHQETILLSDYVGISIESVPSGISILDSNTSEDANYVALRVLANRLENRTKDAHLVKNNTHSLFHIRHKIISEMVYSLYCCNKYFTMK